MAKETSSASVARIAARILAGGRYCEAEVRALAASVLTQRERATIARKPGKRGKVAARKPRTARKGG